MHSSRQTYRIAEMTIESELVGETGDDQEIKSTPTTSSETEGRTATPETPENDNSRFIHEIADARIALEGPVVPPIIFSDKFFPFLANDHPDILDRFRELAEEKWRVDGERLKENETLRKLGLDPGTMDNGDRRFVLLAASISREAAKQAVATLRNEVQARINVRLSKADYRRDGSIGFNSKRQNDTEGV